MGTTKVGLSIEEGGEFWLQLHSMGPVEGLLSRILLRKPVACASTMLKPLLEDFAAGSTERLASIAQPANWATVSANAPRHSNFDSELFMNDSGRISFARQGRSALD